MGRELLVRQSLRRIKLEVIDRRMACNPFPMSRQREVVSVCIAIAAPARGLIR